MDVDDGRRSKHGVVACLVECPGGQTKLVFDDVSGNAETNPVLWAFDWFYTHNRYDSAALKVGLSDEEYRIIGENLVFRLLALGGQAR